MKAIVQVSYGSPDGLELREIEKPAVADDRVLVRVRAASLNAADWHLLKRLPHVIARLFGMRPSRVRGGDLAGVVEAAGKNVTRFQPGDEVFGSGTGTFAELATAPEDRLAPKPRNLTFEQAATLSGAGCSALQGLRDKGEVKPGQRVLIYGAGGGVGTFAVQVARALGARVTAVTRTENLDLVRSIGADEAIDYTVEDFTRRGERWDLVFDIGADRSFRDLKRILSADGKVVLCGAPSSMWLALASLVKAELMSRAGSRQVSYVTRVRQPDLFALKDLAEAGKLVPVIDRQYPLAEVPEALRYLGTKQARGKVVIKVA